MRKILILLLPILFFMPLLAFAEVQQDPSALLSGSGGGLVPQCEGAECRACDLSELANNVINFAVAFSVIVATLMFAYAGILYVTAASKPDQVKKAHGVFINVFVGLCIVLTAWLLVNVTFSVLTGEGVAMWTRISCVGNPTTLAFPNAPQAISPSATPGSPSVRPISSTDDLNRVNPKLICLVNAAHRYSTVPFVVTSGFRETSRTATRSRHLFGAAVDVHPLIGGIAYYDNRDGAVRTPPTPSYIAINAAFERARQDCNNVPFQWGGASSTFMQGRYYDSEHFQLICDRQNICQ